MSPLLSVPALVLGLLLLPSPGRGTPIYQIRRDALVMAGERSASGPFVLRFTVGLPLVGVASNANYREAVGFWFGAPSTTGFEAQGSPLLVTQLLENSPNPFNPSTRIRFSIGGRAGEMQPVSLQLFEVTGRLVRSLVDGPLAPGFYELAWDGRASNEAALPSGVYLARLAVAGEAWTTRLVLLK